VNGESNEDRTGDERESSGDTNARERMRELGRRSGEARRRKREQREKEQLEPLTDHEQAKQALRRALDGGNMAAMVAAAKALLEFDKTDPWAHHAVSVKDAHEQLAAKLDQMEEHARIHGHVCPTCGAPRRPRTAESGPLRGGSEKLRAPGPEGAGTNRNSWPTS
jgi:hypothetical protein